jgi:hypothetical protein
VVVSLFGEDDFDRRDYRMGLAGLLAGIHSLRILAERGIAGPQDIAAARDGIDQVLNGIPEAQLPPEQRAQLNGLLSQIHDVANTYGGAKS